MSEELKLRLTPVMQSALSKGLLFARRLLENGEIEARQTEALQVIVYDIAQPDSKRLSYCWSDKNLEQIRISIPSEALRRTEAYAPRFERQAYEDLGGFVDHS